MKGLITNIDKDTLENEDYRRVLYTAKHSQLVLMCIKPGDEIGEETHTLDQFIRFELGKGVVIMDDVKHQVEEDFGVNSLIARLTAVRLYRPVKGRSRLAQSSFESNKKPPIAGGLEVCVRKQLRTA